MKSIKKFCFFWLSLLVSSQTLATTFNFDGELFIYDPSGVPSGPSVAAGFVHFDPGTGIGTGGVIEEFLPKTGGSTFTDISITGLDGNLYSVDLTVSVLGTSFPGSLIWELIQQTDGSITVLTVDGNDDGIPGLPLSSDTPFEGFSMALDGLLTPVPVPAAFWLFGSGLLGLLGFSRHRRAN